MLLIQSNLPHPFGPVKKAALRTRLRELSSFWLGFSLRRLEIDVNARIGEFGRDRSPAFQAED
jgi:hypothetical protein